MLAAFCCATSACNYSHFALDAEIDGPYRLQAADDVRQAVVSYTDGVVAEERVPPTVFAVGFNNEYISAKIHPYDEKKDTIDRGKVYYYIIKRDLDGKDRLPRDSVTGPISEDEYLKLKIRSLLPNLNNI
jgi:hypothetical protein